jgi:putative SOS response-associated peptidase YedK
VADLLVPCPDDWLTVRPVSRRVNNPANDSPEVLAAAAND